MLSWLAGKVIACNMGSIRRGDIAPTLAMDADDVKFKFPGENSFAPGASNKRELEEWLNRFTAIGLRGHIHLDDAEEGRVRLDEYLSRRSTA